MEKTEDGDWENEKAARIEYAEVVNMNKGEERTERETREWEREI